MKSLRPTNRPLVVFGFAFLVACASAGGSHADTTIDLTGADVARWDSLSRTYAVGPTLLEMPMPILPLPPAMRKTSVTIVCTVDDRGHLTRLSMTPAADLDYGRRLARAWKDALHFQPATTRDGVPSKGYYRIKYDF